MLKLVHSNRVDVLLARLIADHEAQLATGKLGVFDAYQVVVPSSGFRIWLTRAFARELSVCAQINMQLWGTYRWGLERKRAVLLQECCDALTDDAGQSAS